MPREATINDLDSIAKLFNELHSSGVETELLHTQVSTLVENPHSCILLYLDDQSDCVGMALVNLVHKLSKIEARIDEVVVLSSARGHGYSKRLLGACEEWAWSHQADVIELTSRPSRTAANQLYQSAGYSIRETNVYTKERAK